MRAKSFEHAERPRIRRSTSGGFPADHYVRYSRADMKPKGNTIELTLEVDTKQAKVMEYFERFQSQMAMCRRSAELIGYKFALSVNETWLE
ncbi:MAG: hypothetical protein H7Y17_04185 [Chlorobia bacterium]|nr:hypothetical protein [Fimbriimonadaceae bacterium]